MKSPTVTAVTLFLALCLYRILNALLIQTQFDPDEYWQTLEPAYCQAFLASPLSCAYTWEWTRHSRQHETNNETTTLWLVLEQSLQGPIRSFISVLPTYLLYTLAQYAHWDTWWMISKGPMVLHAILVAAPTDYAVYNIAHHVYHHHSNNNNNNNNTQQYAAQWALLLSATSWFHGYALIRTYSNSVETMLLMVGLNLVVPDLYRSPDKSVASRRVAFWHAPVAFVLGGMSVAIRFTSLAAWVPLGILLSARIQKPSMLQQQLQYLIRPCALYGLAGIGISMLVDRYFFGFWVLPFLGSFQFNVVEGHGALYGTHPWYWYLIAGIPAICGLSLPLVLISIRQAVTTSTTTATRPLWIIICSYTLLHSCSAHKEFRFLLPILPLFHVVSASAAVSVVHGNRQKSLCLGGMYVVVNLIAVLYLGVVHQAGPVAIQRGLIQHVAMSTSVTSAAAAATTTTTTTTTVHYWMSCHSTPMYSHLHHRIRTTTTTTTTETQLLSLEAQYLDCSPSCRMDGDGDGCESDAFQNDPRAFIRNRYNMDDKSDSRQDDESECQEDGDDQTCGAPEGGGGLLLLRQQHQQQQQPPSSYDSSDDSRRRKSTAHSRSSSVSSIPDYVAMMSGDEMTLQNELHMMNMVQVGRYPHTLKGVRLGGLITFGTIIESHQKDNNSNGALVQFSFDEMVLWKRQVHT